MMLAGEVLITKATPCDLCGGTLGTGKAWVGGAREHNLCTARRDAGLPTPCLGLRCESCDGSGWHEYVPGRYTGCTHCGGGPGVAGSGKEPGSEADLSPAEFVQAGRVRVAELEKKALTALRRMGNADAVWKFATDRLADLPVADAELPAWHDAIADRNRAMAECARAWEDAQAVAAKLVEADRDLLEVTDDMEKGAR